MSTPEENQNGTPRDSDPTDASTPSQALPGFPPPEQPPTAYPPQPNPAEGAPQAYPPQPGYGQQSDPAPTAYPAPGAPQAYPPQPGYSQPGYGQPAAEQPGYPQAPGAYPPPLGSAPPVSPGQFGQPAQIPPQVSQPLAKFTLIQYGVLALGALINTWVGLFTGGDPALAQLDNNFLVVSGIFASIFTIAIAAGSAALIFFPVRRGRAWGRTVGTIFASFSGLFGVIQLIGSLIGLASAPGAALLGIVLALAAVAVSAYWLVLAWRKPRV